MSEIIVNKKPQIFNCDNKLIGIDTVSGGKAYCCGKNLLKPYKTHNAMTFNDDGSILLKLGVTTNTVEIFGENKSNYHNEEIGLLSQLGLIPGQKYILSCKCEASEPHVAKLKLNYYKSNNSSVFQENAYDINQTETITIPSEAVYVQIGFKGTSTAGECLLYPQIELGETATEFEKPTGLQTIEGPSIIALNGKSMYIYSENDNTKLTTTSSKSLEVGSSPKVLNIAGDSLFGVTMVSSVNDNTIYYSGKNLVRSSKFISIDENGYCNVSASTGVMANLIKVDTSKAYTFTLFEGPSSISIYPDPNSTANYSLSAGATRTLNSNTHSNAFKIHFPEIGKYKLQIELGNQSTEFEKPNYGTLSTTTSPINLTNLPNSLYLYTKEGTATLTANSEGYNVNAKICPVRLSNNDFVTTYKDIIPLRGEMIWVEDANDDNVVTARIGDGIHRLADLPAATASAKNPVFQGGVTEGVGTANKFASQGVHVQGSYNTEDENLIHVVGGGTNENDKKNIHTIDKNGNAWFAGEIYVGGEEADNQVATKEWVRGQSSQEPIYYEHVTSFSAGSSRSNETWVATLGTSTSYELVYEGIRYDYAPEIHLSDNNWKPSSFIFHVTDLKYEANTGKEMVNEVIRIISELTKGTNPKIKKTEPVPYQEDETITIESVIEMAKKNFKVTNSSSGSSLFLVERFKASNIRVETGTEFLTKDEMYDLSIYIIKILLAYRSEIQDYLINEEKCEYKYIPFKLISLDQIETLSNTGAWKEMTNFYMFIPVAYSSHSEKMAWFNSTETHAIVEMFNTINDTSKQRDEKIEILNSIITSEFNFFSLFAILNSNFDDFNGYYIPMTFSEPINQTIRQSSNCYVINNIDLNTTTHIKCCKLGPPPYNVIGLSNRNRGLSGFMTGKIVSGDQSGWYAYTMGKLYDNYYYDLNLNNGMVINITKNKTNNNMIRAQGIGGSYKIPMFYNANTKPLLSQNVKLSWDNTLTPMLIQLIQQNKITNIQIPALNSNNEAIYNYKALNQDDDIILFEGVSENGSTAQALEV